MTQDGKLLKSWLAALGNPPLLVACANKAVRDVLAAGASARGYDVVEASRGQETYQLALQHRPMAIICDAHLPDAEARLVLNALRCNYLVREIPVMIVDSAKIAQRSAEQGKAAGDPVLDSLNGVLSPGPTLYDRLRSQVAGDLADQVEPIGLGQLLRTLAAAEVSGELRLHSMDQRRAQVTVARGALYEARSESPGLPSRSGLEALVDLMGQQWQEFTFARRGGSPPEGQPIGETASLVETAKQQNNALLLRLFREGVKLEGVHLDEAALDRYLRTVPAGYLDLLIHVVDGDPAAQLTIDGPKSVVKSMLQEMRRSGVLLLSSLEAIRGQEATDWSGFPDARAPLSRRRERSQSLAAPRTGRRIVVMLAACLTTVALAFGAFMLMRRYAPDQGTTRPGVETNATGLYDAHSAGNP